MTPKTKKKAPAKGTALRPIHEKDFEAIAAMWIRGLISDAEKADLWNRAADWYAANPPKTPKASAKGVARSRPKSPSHPPKSKRGAA